MQSVWQSNCIFMGVWEVTQYRRAGWAQSNRGTAICSSRTMCAHEISENSTYMDLFRERRLGRGKRDGKGNARGIISGLGHSSRCLIPVDCQLVHQNGCLMQMGDILYLLHYFFTIPASPLTRKHAGENHQNASRDLPRLGNAARWTSGRDLMPFQWYGTPSGTI